MIRRFLKQLHLKGEDTRKIDSPGQGQALSDHPARSYLSARGPEAYREFTSPLAAQVDTSIRGKETIKDLRAKLLLGGVKLKQPVEITVTGTFFPCALLSSGWWERPDEEHTLQVKWRDEVQEWLFRGFDLWGPSWDFTWNFDHEKESENQEYFIAQLGYGDEADSLPVLIPKDKAESLREDLCKWGCFEAEITGVLGHREHFQEQHPDSRLLLPIERFGGLLDYCLWIDKDNKRHKIEPKLTQTRIYSGYLWKCVVPKQQLKGGDPSLEDVYFVWEHANFASTDAMAYSLEALEQKEAYIKRWSGDDLVLIQKSSWLVPGEPLWKPQEFYSRLLASWDWD